MSFSLETYDRRYVEGMTRLYNAETAFEKHIAPLNPERFIELIEKKTYFHPAGLLVALEDGEVIGWIHACVAAGSEGGHNPEHPVARIRMLIYPRDRLRVGQALVKEATDWLKKSGQREFEAMHAKAGYPFYRGLWMGSEPMCPATLPHIQLAFEVGGYKNTQESVFMVAAMTSIPTEMRTSVEVELIESPAEMKHAPMQESWIGFEPMRIQARVDGEEAGSIAWVLQPHVADRLGAPCMNIWGLGVGEQHRRKGIASALICRAIALSYAQGARFASVGTQLWNAPAHATYAGLGFSPHTVLVGRILDLDSQKT